MARTPLLLLIAVLVLTACSPWRDTYTLSPAVKESARRYSDVMDDFANQALLANVLRAKDYAPLNFNDLSAITGSLSLSGTLALTLPYGGLTGMPTTSSTYRNTASPTLMGSTSPVITLGTLNTQGFMMTMIQPVSTTYILSKWNTAPHQLLLYLFAKSIRFPNERTIYRNDPDNEPDFGAFQTLVDQMVDKGGTGGDIDMRSLMILDPLGNPLPASQSLVATTSPGTVGQPVTAGTTVQISSDYNLYQTINGLADGQLHVGNAGCPDYAPDDLCPTGSPSPFVQFYKEYPAQVVLCVRTDPLTGEFFGHRIAPKSPDESRALTSNNASAASAARVQGDKENLAAYSAFFSFMGGKPPGNGNSQSGNSSSTSAGAPSGGGGGGGGGAGGGSGAMPQVTLALQPSRISAVLHSETCDTDQIVLPPSTEELFHDRSRQFTHIEWRSIAEVIQYVGAVARFQDRHPRQPLPQWTGVSGNAVVTHRLFTYQEGGSGRIYAHYAGDDFTVPMSPKTSEPPVDDHSLQTLALLNELIGIAKISGSLPVSQPVQVLP
jgi:uncharacterized membrane protein YgcG